MATTTNTFISLAIVIMIIVAPLASDAAITCGQVLVGAAPCLAYVRGTGALTKGCCNGVNSLNKAAANTADRQQLCKCLKQVASSYTGIIPGNALSLPKKCGVNVPFKISTSTNCAAIK